MRQSKSLRHRFLQLSVVLAIFIVLFVKAFFRSGDLNYFLFSYGLTVTAIVLLVIFCSFYLYKDPYFTALEKLGYKKYKKYRVGCMLAALNEEENIARCIESILAQTYKNIEIIVVNDGSTDGTLKILRRYEKQKKIIVINLKQRIGKKRALGRAMAVAHGDIYAMTDSDSTWAPDVIDKMAAIFASDEMIGAISGHSRALNADTNLLTKVQDSWYEGQYSVRKAFESIFNSVTCVSGPLAVFRREAIYNFIPAWEGDTFLGQEFKMATDRMLTGFVLGSTAIGAKLKKKYKDSKFVTKVDYPTREWKIVYCKSARSMTIVPDTFKRFMNQQIRWKKSFIRNIFFTGLFYWRKPFIPALVYYLHILFVLAGPFIAFRHLIYLPIQGNILSGVLYLAGIIFVGFMFGLAYKLEDKNSNKWIYRPLMSLLSTIILTWVIFYSALTIKKMIWVRG